MNDVLVEELILPEAVGSERWSDFVDLVAVRNQVEVGILGTDALSFAPEAILSYFGDNPHLKRRHFVARIDGKVVGRAIIGWPTAAGARDASINIDVLPDHRGRGVGTALLGRTESYALGLGRDVLQTDQPHTPVQGGPRIASPTGFGDVSADDPGVRFLVAKGYELEMVARISSLDLSGAATVVDSHRRRAQEHAGADYRVLTWIGRTPEDRVEDLAALKTGMSTDAPMAGMEVTVKHWTVDDVRDHGNRQAATGRTLLVAAAEHVPSGRLVAFTELEFPPGDAPAAVQEDTLVLRTHRGHRLGMLLKAANIEQLLRVAPSARVVTTFNAEDNRPMLNVNEALGFLPIGLEGNWQKRVGSAGD